MVGRPSIYTPETVAKICELVMDGYTLRQISAQDGMPDKSTICKWLSEKPDFSDQYARAREIQADHMADEIIEIADDGSNDWMTREGKEPALDGEHVQRSRLRVDSRKWLMSKMAAKKYGDRVLNEHSGPNGQPIETKDVSPRDIARDLLFLLAKAKSEKTTDG